MQKTFPLLPGGWEVVDKLGAGSSGAVYRATRTTAGLVEWAAVKHIPVPKDEDELRDIQNNPILHTGQGVKTFIDEMKDTLVKEYSQMLLLRGHTNVVTCFDIQIEQKKDNPGYDVFIWMELLSSLPERINAGKMDRAQTIRLGIDICNALIQLERKRLVHRDIKPQNLFVNEDGDYKLGDFGTTRAIQGTSTVLSGKGTPAYMAPEIILNKKANFTADIYSLGLVLYELMNGNRPPFIKPDEMVTQTSLSVASVRRVQGEPLPMPANADPDLAKIIMKACEHDPRKRWHSAEDMKAALEKLKGPRKAVLNGKLVTILLLAALLGTGGYFLSQAEDFEMPDFVSQWVAKPGTATPKASTATPKPTVAASNVKASYSHNTGKLTLTWSGSASAWEVSYGLTGQTPTKKVAANAKRCEISGLSLGEGYTFYVYPKGAGYTDATSYRLVYSLPTATPKPATATPKPTAAAKNVSASYNSSTRNLTLSWTGNGSNWTVRYGYSGGSYATKTTTGTSMVFSNLVEGKTYSFHVYPTGDSYNGSTSANCEKTIPARPKAANVTSDYNSTTGNLTLKWSGDASSWSIRYGYSGGSYTTRTTTGKSMVLSDLTGGKTYTFYVYPTGDSYNGDTSASHSRAIPESTKGKVSGLKGSFDNGAGTFTLTWTSSASAWTVRYGYSGGSYFTTNTSSKKIVLSLTRGKTYTFYVYPKGDSYNGATSASLNFTVPAAEKAESAKASYNSSTKQLTLSWTGSAASWDIRYGYDGGSYTVKTTTAKSMVLSNLAAGKTYNFYVYPKGESYNGSTSAKCSYKIPAASTSSTNRTFSVSTSAKTNKGQTTFSWTDSENQAPYTLEYTLTGTKQYTYKITGISGKSKVVYDAIPGEQYKVVVKDKNGKSVTGYVTVPKPATFSDGKLKPSSVSISIEGRYRPSSSTEYKNAQQVTLIAKNMANGIKNKGYQFGIRYQINFPQLVTARSYETMKVYRAPNGFKLAEYDGLETYSDFNNHAGGSYFYWYCCGENFFRQLLNTNGSIPAGKYYVDLYWDGMFVKTQSFEVK